MTETVTRVNLYGKPAERLILIALCKRDNQRFIYDEKTGYASIIGNSSSNTRDEFFRIITIAYKKLAFAQAQKQFADVPIKSLNSEFMRAFAAMACSLITGEPFTFKADTEIERAGLRAFSNG